MKVNKIIKIIIIIFNIQIGNVKINIEMNIVITIKTIGSEEGMKINGLFLVFLLLFMLSCPLAFKPRPLTALAYFTTILYACSFAPKTIIVLRT